VAPDETGPAPSAKVKLGLSAEAKFEARVTAEIPTQSTGRLIDAITDIFRPFSEQRGLRADQIRLQREDVLLEIAKRAHTRLTIEGAAISPIPNKILIPFMEKASLEDRDSVLIDRWVDLLVSAAQSPPSVHPRLVQILSELTSDEAMLLRCIALNGEFARYRLEDSTVEYEWHAARSGLLQIIEDNLATENFTEDDEKMYRLEQKILEQDVYGKIRNFFMFPGVCPVLIMIAVGRQEVWTTEKNDNQIIKEINGNEIEYIINNRETSISVLRSLGLVNNNHIVTTKGSLEIDAYYINITDLGINLLLNCDREIRNS